MRRAGLSIALIGLAVALGEQGAGLVMPARSDNGPFDPDEMAKDRKFTDARKAAAQAKRDRKSARRAGR